MANLARARLTVRAARTFMSPKAAGAPSNLSLQLAAIDALDHRMSISRNDRREEITLISAAAAAFFAAFAVALAVIAAVLAVVVG
jgi:hypothetical protein